MRLHLGQPAISIHAPANGATMGIPLYDDSYTISIHAPANGATKSEPAQSSAEIYFNPRSGERSDLNTGIFFSR